MIIYKMTSYTNNMALRMGAGSTNALVKPTDNPKIVNGYVTKNTEMIGDRVVPVGTVDKWLHVTSVDGIPCDGYVAQISGGTKYCEIREIVSVDPTLKQKIVSVKITPTYEDGTVGLAEDYYPTLTIP